MDHHLLNGKLWNLEQNLNDKIMNYEKSKKIYQTLLTYCLQRNKSAPSAIFKVVATTVFPLKERLHTLFRYSNGKLITTVISPSNKINDNELNSLLRLAASSFNPEDIKEDFQDKDAMVEMIYSDQPDEDEKIKNNLIGFLIYKTICETYLYWSLAYLAPEYRGLGLMPLLLFRQAYAMDYKGIFMLSIHPNSYKVVDKNLQHFPKHQSKELKALVTELLAAVLQVKNCEIHQQGLTCYIDGQIELKQKIMQTSQLSFSDKFFFSYLLNLPDDAITTKNRAAPILFHLDSAHLARLNAVFANQGINFVEQVNNLAKNTPKELSILCPAKHHTLFGVAATSEPTIAANDNQGLGLHRN